VKANQLCCAFLALQGLVSGCSHSQPDDIHHLKKTESPAVALARQHECVVLGEELKKAIGTNTVFSFHIQQVLRNNTRFAASASLMDLVQSGEHTEAVFEISIFDLALWMSGTCVAKLECPTNLIPVLASNHTGYVCIAFESSQNRHALHFTTHPSGDDDHVVLSSLITVEGRLIAVSTKAGE
jgi:hypothetical protein